MGYTHYWRNEPIPADTWSKLVADVRRIIDAAQVPLAGPDGTGDLIIDDKEICLNGTAPDGDYETFIIDVTPGLSDDFCKTGRRPYDLVVATALLRATLTVPGFLIDSDGHWDTGDWRPARDLYATLFGPAPEASPLVRL